MKILFITRKYPPAIGGMETFSYGLYQALQPNCIVLALRGAQWQLLWWLPYALLRGIWLSRRVAVIHIGDGVLAWLGVILHWLTHKPITITVHGLDLTYRRFGYQAWLWAALPRYQAIICVSHFTQSIVLQHGLRADRLSVISHGVEVAADSAIPDDTSPVIHLLTVGRLVKRKGVAWFIAYVLPHLPSNVEYWVVGVGPEQTRIEHTIRQLQLERRVQLFGQVSTDQLHRLYARAQWCIMPNLAVQNDVEGFGMVAIEAAAYGLPVVAASLEGIQDAVVDGQTGLLVESGSIMAWRDTLQREFLRPSLRRQQVKQAAQHYWSWPHIAQHYYALFKQLV